VILYEPFLIFLLSSTLIIGGLFTIPFLGVNVGSVSLGIFLAYCILGFFNFSASFLLETK